MYRGQGQGQNYSVGDAELVVAILVWTLRNSPSHVGAMLGATIVNPTCGETGDQHSAIDYESG